MSKESASFCIRRMRWLSCGLAALAVVVCSLGIVPFVWAGEGDCPKADVILDKYIEATGGKTAYENVHNNVVKATFMAGMGMQGSVTIYGAEPNKSYSIVESESIGTVERGFDGEVAWEKSTMQGPRIIKGPERVFRVRDAEFHPELLWRDLYKNVECVGVETVNDKECCKVVMTPTEGSPETRFYDKDTGLLVKTETVIDTAMGQIPIEMFVSDYRKEDDLLVPHQYDQVMPMGKQVMMIQSVENNVDMPADRFDLPDEIKALLKQEKESAEPTEEPEKESES